MTDAVNVFFRWLHVVTACIAVGGVFFMRVVVPIGSTILEPDVRHALLLRMRRVFKMVIHSAILLFLISGIYNSWRNWPVYNQQAAMPLSHALFGIHVLLALAVFGIALYVLAGAEPPKAHLKLMSVNLVLLLLAIAAASTLKMVRERALRATAATPTNLSLR